MFNVLRCCNQMLFEQAVIVFEKFTGNVHASTQSIYTHSTVLWVQQHCKLIYNYSCSSYLLCWIFQQGACHSCTPLQGVVFFWTSTQRYPSRVLQSRQRQHLHCSWVCTLITCTLRGFHVRVQVYICIYSVYKGLKSSLKKKPEV